jgi:hypothetical protein
MCLKTTKMTRNKNNNSKSFDRLEEVASKKEEWATLPVTEKVKLLKSIVSLFKSQGYESFKIMGNDGITMMGIPTTTDEGRLESATQTFMLISTIKAELESLLYIFQIRAAGSEKAPKKLTNLKTRKAINGQVCVSTFPLLPSDSMSISAGCTGEAWMDANAVKEERDVTPFAFDQFEASSDGGVMVVLGAGNQAFLSVMDVLHGLFVKNSVVYLKHHPLRSYVDPLLRAILAPLIDRSFFDTELHSSVQRSASLVEHPVVTGIHLTGGKATHDAIVWGSDPHERETNIRNNKPKLKSAMTSELGAVSPWIVVPGEYSEVELRAQAKMLAMFLHANASCNCNAPKVICISDSWNQKDHFLDVVETSLREHTLPVAYYPGANGRWQAFRKMYPDATELHSETGLGVQERQLAAPFGAKEVCVLPLLKIEVSVDLSSESGRQTAKKEYAFNNDSFAPVYTVAVFQNTDTLASFCETASTFCNDYLFGSLSGTVTVSPAVESSADEFQTLIANLQYGSIGINTWAGTCYSPPGGGWGAFPGESLDSVESGIGKIQNLLFLPHFEKFVLRSPLVSMAHGQLKLKQQKIEGRLIESLGKFILTPGLKSFVGIFSAVVGVDLAQVFLVCSGLAFAVGIASLSNQFDLPVLWQFYNFTSS